MVKVKYWVYWQQKLLIMYWRNEQLPMKIPKKRQSFQRLRIRNQNQAIKLIMFTIREIHQFTKYCCIQAHHRVFLTERIPHFWTTAFQQQLPPIVVIQNSEHSKCATTTKKRYAFEWEHFTSKSTHTHKIHLILTRNRVFCFSWQLSMCLM